MTINVFYKEIILSIRNNIYIECNNYDFLKSIFYNRIRCLLNILNIYFKISFI